MQGVLPDASAFLVSGLASRRWYSEALLEEGATDRLADAAMAAGPRMPGGALPPKAREALAILLREQAQTLPAGVAIRLQSNIPKGKGLSSSSADVLSVLSVVNDYLGMGLGAGELYKIAAQVEPTDPCLSNEIVVFHQHRGKIATVIDLPSLSLLYFDAAPDRQVDTLEIRRCWSRGAGDFFGWLLRRLLRAAEEGDYVLLFDSITYSAEYNQTILPLPGFDAYYKLAAEAGAGLMVAHSGTIAGLLVPLEKEAALLPRLERLVNSPIYIEHHLLPNYRSACRPYSAP